MKLWNRFWLGLLGLIAALALFNAVILGYTLLQEQPYAQITTLFILLVAGFGTDHWRKRKLNNRIPNPYKQN